MKLSDFLHEKSISGHQGAASRDNGAGDIFGQEITSRANNPLGTYSCQTSEKSALEVISCPKISLA